MAQKAFSKMSRYELVDIIYTLQTNEQELKKELDSTKQQLQKVTAQLDEALKAVNDISDIKRYLMGEEPVPAPVEEQEYVPQPVTPAMETIAYDDYHDTAAEDKGEFLSFEEKLAQLLKNVDAEGETPWNLV